MTFASTSAKQKPILDESSFQQLLAAAYVVQQHNDNLWAKIPLLDTAGVLSEIAEMQAMAQTGELELSLAGKLITERLLRMVAATGVSLSLVNDGFLDCVAESGVPAQVAGSSIASHSLVATERLKSGEVFASADSRADMRLDAGMCSGLGVGSLIAAPVVCFSQLAGLVEVRWARPHAFNETGLLACRLMASLVAGLLERKTRPVQNDVRTPAPETTIPEPEPQPEQDANAAAPELVATESSVSLEENHGSTAEPQVNSEEPQATKTVPADPATVAADISSAVVAPSSMKSEQAEDVLSSAFGDHLDEVVSAQVLTPTGDVTAMNCRVCGRPFGDEESFCGYCSMPRGAPDPSPELQSKWASMWFMQKAQGTMLEGEEETTSTIAASPQPVSEPLELVPTEARVEQMPNPLPAPIAEVKEHFSYFEPLPVEHDAASETEFWERAAAAADASKSFLKRLRAKDVALAVVAIVLTFGVVSAWPSSTGKLTWFGSMVVRLGLARHAVPTYAGNPAVNVWVDEQTSLYYCPGADLYGNTPAGHFATQLEAEQAQLQPASGLVCQ